MRHHVFHKAAAALAILCSAGAGLPVHAQTEAAARSGPKELLLPPDIGGRVPRDNDFNDPEAAYCFKHSKSTDNFVMFWEKGYGDNPMTNTGRLYFDVDGILKESDRFYNYYIDTLKWVDPKTSYATKYKFLFFVIPNPANGAGTATGGAVGNGKIGAFWSPAARINRGPYGVVAHELGHSFQAMDRADGAVATPGGFGEMTSQYMLWQVYPEWLTFENYHFVDYMKATHLAFLNQANQYHTAEVPEYWSEKHGLDFIGKMWRETQRGEDVVTTYKRLTGITQAQLNDEMFDADRRFVTWDLPRIEKVAAPYRNKDTTSINQEADGWYQIAPEKCPQNYGYNAIQLKVPAAETKVSLDFKGIVGAEGYHSIKPELAGWRYGFLAYKKDGSRVYSDMFSKSPGTAEFTVPADTEFLWLVVTGAPTEHTIRAGRGGGGGRGGRGGATNNATANGATNMVTNAPANVAASSNAYEEWPYSFKLAGTTPVDSIIH